jgi:uncharacterized membrane protein
MTVAGLPLHPLVVHVAIVFIPLATIALLMLGWRASWRARFGLPIALAATIGAVGAFVAAQSDEQLEDSFRDLARAAGHRLQLGNHPDYGDAAEITAIAFAVMALLLWQLPRWEARLPRWAPTAVYMLAAGSALAALTAVTLAGDSGARLVWQELGTFAPR